MLSSEANMTQRGFTMIEAMVVVAIMAVMAMVAAPSLGVWMDNTRIRATSDAIQQGIQTARTEAIRRNQRVTFWLVSHNVSNQLDNTCVLDNTSGSWVVSVTSPSKLCATDISTTSAPRIVAKRALADSGANVVVEALHIDTDGSTSAADHIEFDSYGRVTNPGDAISAISITGPDASASYKNLRVQISTAGQVRSCDPNVSTTGDPRKC